MVRAAMLMVAEKETGSRAESSRDEDFKILFGSDQDEG